MKIDPNTVTEIGQALGEHGLLADGVQFGIAPLSGGVSCDVFLVEAKRQPAVVVKRPLAKLRVTADWRAPISRSESEVEWLELVAKLDPRLVPRVIVNDPARHLFVMEYLPKQQYPVWKDGLSAGVVDATFAASAGNWLSRIHASTAGSSSLARKFAQQEQFKALRLDAYLLHAARGNDDVAARLSSLADGVANSKIALMQGDISPKNILHGPETPVFLDAETTCYGDPAFDLAFCLNHLLLKCVWHPEHTRAYAGAFTALKDSYLRGVVWEPREKLERRAADLVAGLMLARIDGKSPVEYITDGRQKDFVRARAKKFLRASNPTLDQMREDWIRETQTYFAVSGTS